MKLFIISIVVLSSIVTKAKTKIAVIDSGYTKTEGLPFNVKLCKNDHYDFIKNKSSIGEDGEHLHGTIVVNILASWLQDKKGYCLVVMKVMNNNRESSGGGLLAKAITKAVRNNVKIINMSVIENRYNYKLEKAIKFAKSRGVKIFTAAGNNSENLNIKCNIFPGCLWRHDNLYTVGALDEYGFKAGYSNYGLPIKIWESGEGIFNGRGTSFASPRAAARYARSILKDK